MSQGKGSEGQLLFWEETTYGTRPETVSAIDIPFVSESITGKQTQNKRATISSNRMERRPALGSKDSRGDIVVELNNHAHANFIKHLLGSVSTTGADPYEHAIKGGSLPVGFGLEKGLTDISEFLVFDGMRIDRAAFDFPETGIYQATFSVLGNGLFERATTSEDAAPTSNTDEVFTEFHGAIEEGGSSIAIVKRLNVEVVNNLDGDTGRTLGAAGLRTSLPEGMLGVAGTLTAQFHDATLLTKALANTETSIKYTLTRDANNIIEFFIPELTYEPQAWTIQGPQGIVIDLPFMAYYDDGADASSIKITVTNDIATL